MNDEYKGGHSINLLLTRVWGQKFKIGESGNLTDIHLIKDLSLNIDSRKRNRNSVFLCEKRV